MSDVIKPEEIPQDLAESVCLFSDVSPRQGRFLAANLLNAAIQIGLVTRRIPDADDPRVLRRALRDVAKDLIWTSDIDIDETVEEWIELARRELESEGKDGISG